MTSPDLKNQELSLPPDRKADELQRMQMYGARQDKESVTQWLVASLTCDQFLANYSDITNHPEPLIQKTYSAPPYQDFSYLINHLRFSPPNSEWSNTEKFLYLNWLQAVFINTGKTGQQSNSHFDHDTILYFDLIDLFKLPPKKAKRFFLNNKFKSLYQDNRKILPDSITGETISLLELTQPSLDFLIIHGYQHHLVEHDKPICVFRVVDRSSNAIITTSFGPKPTVVAYSDLQNGLVYSYFSYQNTNNEAEFAPAWFGPERNTSPDQLAYTLADFYLAEN